MVGYLYFDWIEVTWSRVRCARKPKVRMFLFFDFIWKTRIFLSLNCSRTVNWTLAPERTGVPTDVVFPSSEAMRSGSTVRVAPTSWSWWSTSIIDFSFTMYWCPPTFTTAIIKKNYARTRGFRASIRVTRRDKSVIIQNYLENTRSTLYGSFSICKKKVFSLTEDSHFFPRTFRKTRYYYFAYFYRKVNIFSRDFAFSLVKNICKRE